ncbi:MAG TPA: AAA family ATPase [Mycobacteriales bacterium]|nr:AAA family ATPase [Mycobacteriales bacterium]
MRLIRTHIENFKLLENVKINFSTDPKKPLTVIRAENGSGKTSILYALLWAFYGMPGLPDSARRLTSTALPAGTPVEISVMVEFEHTDDNDITTRYRVVRSVTETPQAGDKVDRGRDRVRLFKITSAGEDEIEGADALIGKFIPLRLKDIFFTNGDDVQTFISGSVSSQQRQDRVHRSIRMLLSLDTLRTAKEDLEFVFKKLRAEVSRSGGSDTSKLETALEETEAELADERARSDEVTEQLANMTEQKNNWEKELNGLRGFGDLDELNTRIETAERDRELLEKARARALGRMREALRSEAISWTLMSDQLDEGMKLLSDLVDRRVIPGTSIEVLTDRLELKECICGEALEPGSGHRHRVEQLRDEQRAESDSRQRLTGLFHTARQARAAEDARQEQNDAYGDQRLKLLSEFTDAKDSLAAKATELEQLKERRRQIDEDRVRDLTGKIAGVERKIGDARTEFGGIQARIQQLDDRRQVQDQQLREAEKAVRASGDLVVKRDVSQDLAALAAGTLEMLEGDYVRRVSDRMNELFMDIVGSHPGFEAGVFEGVHIDENYNIIVDTHDGRTLDTDFELNGASQRALTVSFIWALMEVSGTTAPRIIDTPLGMITGGVKTRMVDRITRPSGADLPDFQVVLLLTRSEIRDVEELLDNSAGEIVSISCSKDYPTDLVNPWGIDHPVVRACSCDHHQSCRICARQYDDRHGIDFRDVEAAV